LIGGGGGSALRGIGGAAGGGAAGACGTLVGAVTQPASSTASVIAGATKDLLKRSRFARVREAMAAMIGSDSSGMDGVEF
jgi:hypothetical protein